MRIAFPIVIGLLVGGSVATIAKPDAVSPRTASAVLAVWDNPLGTSAEALILTETGPEGLVSRYLLRAPNGGRAVLTHRFDPRQGRFTSILQDDATGWSVSMERVWEVKFKDLDEVTDQAKLIAMITREDHGQTLALWSSATPRFEVRSTFSNESFLAEAVAELKGRGQLAQLAGAIPADARAAVTFLAELLDGGPGLHEPSQFRDLVFVLSSVLTEDAGRAPIKASAEKEWTYRMAEAKKGTRDLSAAQAAFAERFRHVTPGDPLAGERLTTEAARSPAPAPG